MSLRIKKTSLIIYFIFFIFSAVPIIFFSISGCGGNISKDSFRTDSAGKMFPEKISPDHCRIIGTVVKIDTLLYRQDLNSPCSKAPCMADVRIDSVLGYGSDFPPLKLGKVIKVRFGFTLSPTTKDLFPHIVGYFPGLDVNDSFKADLQRIVEVDSTRNKEGYIIYSYLKK